MEGLLPMAEFVYNNAVHSSIGVSPFFACYGWNPRKHPDLPHAIGVLDPARQEFAQGQPELTQYLQEQIRQAQAHAVEQYNCKHTDMELKVGNLVYINRHNWKTRRPSPKLNTRFAGRYPIIERVGRWAYCLQLPPKLRVHNVFHILMLEKARSSALPGHMEHQVQPQIHEEDLDFEVEAIMGKCG